MDSRSAGRGERQNRWDDAIPAIGRSRLCAAADHCHGRRLRRRRLKDKGQVVGSGVEGPGHREGVVERLTPLAQSRYRITDLSIPYLTATARAEVDREVPIS